MKAQIKVSTAGLLGNYPTIMVDPPVEYLKICNFPEIRPVTLLSVLVFHGEGGVLQTLLQGKGEGERYCRNSGNGGRGFHFWIIDRDFLTFQKFCPIKSPHNGSPEAARHLR